MGSININENSFTGPDILISRNTADGLKAISKPEFQTNQLEAYSPTNPTNLFFKASETLSDVLGLGFTNVEGVGFYRASDATGYGLMGRVDVGGFNYINANVLKPLAGDIGAIYAILDAVGNDVAFIDSWRGIVLGSDIADTASGLRIAISDGAGQDRFTVEGATGDIIKVGNITSTGDIITSGNLEIDNTLFKVNSSLNTVSISSTTTPPFTVSRTGGTGMIQVANFEAPGGAFANILVGQAFVMHAASNLASFGCQGGFGMRIDNSDNVTILGSLTVDTGATTSNAITISATDLTTANAINMTDLDSLTSGGALRISSNSASTTSRALVYIHNDNILSNGTRVLELIQDNANTAALVITAANAAMSITSGTIYSQGALDLAGHSAFGNNATIDNDIFGGGSANVTAVFNETKTDFTNPVYGITNNVRLQAGVNTAQDIRGFVTQVSTGDNFDYTGINLVADIVFQHEGTGTVNYGIGIAAISDNISTGTIDNAVGVMGEVTNSNTGTINYAAGFRSVISNNSTGTITEAASFLADIPTNTGIITNLYGIFIEDHSGIGVTDSINIISKGANSLNVFEGNVDAATYSVAGAAGASGTFTTVDLKTVTVVAGLITQIV